jgi:hypothetical protein
MKLPRSSVERFESLAGSLYGLRRGFRVGDINSVLKALRWMPVGAEQSLEETDVVCGHEMPTWQSQMWVKNGQPLLLRFIISNCKKRLRT